MSEHLETDASRELAALRAENQALREQAGDFKSALSSVAPNVLDVILQLPVILWAIDATGHITMSDGHGLGALGLASGQLVGANVFDVFAEDAAALASIRGGLRGETTFSLVDVRGATWENRYFPRVEEDEIVGLFGLSMDVTEQRRSEEAVREADNRWRSLVDHAPSIISILDDEHRFVFVNRAIGRDSTEAVIGTSVYSWVDEAIARPAIDAAFGGSTTEVYESTYQPPDRELMYFEHRPAPIGGEGGTIDRVMLVSSDVTERKRAAQKRDDLERQVQRAQKLESLGVLAGGIAHDFNNLLASMLGHAELAALRLRDDRLAAEHIAEIEIAASRAADLCKQLLAYAGRASLKPHRVDLSSIAAEIWQLLAVSVSTAVDFDRRLAPDLWAVKGDPTQLHQVMLNLVTNAAEALPGGSGKVSLSTRNATLDSAMLADLRLVRPLEPGDFVVLEVTDDGAGLDEATRDRMFDPFFTTKETGSGLGLASVLGIVSGHNGSISVDSDESGTRMRVYLPRHRYVGRDDEQPKHENMGIAFADGKLALVVDDDPAVRKVCEEIVQLLGFRTMSAGGGREALELFVRNREVIDVVLIDITMPDVNGIEAAETMLELDPTAKILFCSGHLEQNVSLPAGARGLVNKPYRLATLREVLVRLLAE